MKNAETLRLLIQWPSYGPYHVARFQATRRKLEERGIEVVALETTPRDRYNWQAISASRPEPVEVLFPHTPYEALTAPALHRRTWEALNRLQPDAVAITSYSFPDARACLLWCRRHRRAAILMTPSKADDAPRKPLREWLKGRIVQQFDAALVGGSLHRAYYASLGMPEARIFYGYNVVDNTFWMQKAAHYRQHPEHGEPFSLQPFFLTVTRFLQRKNLPNLLEAYARYRQEVASPWKLVIVGDGPLLPAIQTHIQQRALPDVVLAGKRSMEEVAMFYSAAEALVHPAETDQWGLVVNEAMAAGLPVLVSTGAGCYPELVEEGVNGFTFAPHDVQQLTQLMKALTLMPKVQRMEMARASQRIIGRWGPERFAEGLGQAWEAARLHQNRGIHPLVGAALWGLNRLVRRPTAFHTVEL